MNKKLLAVFEVLFGVFVVLTVSYFLGNWLINKIVHSKNEVLVPDIQGKAIAQAFDILAKKDLSMKKTGEEFTRALPANTVIRQSPPPGSVVRKDRSVKVVLSIGSELKITPDLTNKSLRDAEIELRRSSLTLGEISKKYSLKFKKDEIIYQDPAAGTVVEKDALLNVIISDGKPPPQTALMVDFANEHIDAARKWASENNFEIFSVTEKEDNIALSGTILKQEPEFDSEIKEGTLISFVVSSGAPSGTGQGEKIFEYSVPQGSTASQIKIVLKEGKSEKVLFKGRQNPGTKIRVPYIGSPGAKIRVFVNDILVDEKSAAE